MIRLWGVVILQIEKKWGYLIILQNKKRNCRWRDPGWKNRELKGKQMMISVLSIQIFFPPPVYILQEPEPFRPATAHVNRLLHFHRHYITSFHIRSVGRVGRKYHNVSFDVKRFLSNFFCFTLKRFQIHWLSMLLFKEPHSESHF